MSVTIESDLKEILLKFEQRLDKLDQKLDSVQKVVTDFRTETKVAIESVKGEIKALDNKVDSIDKRLEKVETSQRNQIWVLISILGTALLGTVIRYVLTALPVIANP